MGRVPYYPDYDSYRRHYGSGLPVFKGRLYAQQGTGFFGNLVKRVVPILSKTVLPALKSTAKEAGKTLLRSGTDLLGDVISGEKDFKTAFHDRKKEALTDIRKSVVKRLRSDSSQREAPPKKRKKKRQNKRSDIFDK